MTAPLAIDDNAQAYGQTNPDGPTEASVYDGTTADPAISARAVITLAAGETPVIGARRVDHANATDYGFGADGVEYLLTTTDGDLIPDVAGLVSIDVLNNDIEQGSSILRATLAIDTPPTQGAAASINGMLYYAPIADIFEVADSLTYTVENTLSEESNAATLTVSIVDLGAVALGVLRAGMLPGITATFDPQPQLVGQVSTPPVVLEVEITTAPTFGTATVVGRKVEYESPATMGIEDTFAWRVLVNGLWTEPATVTIVVGQTWRKPGLRRFTRNLIDSGSATPLVARPDATTTPYGTEVTIDVVSNDTGNDIEIVAIRDALSGAVPANNLDGTITYLPPVNFSGTDSFTYTISDGVRSSTAKVTIEVGAPPLVAVTDVATTELTDLVNIHVLANDIGTGIEITDVSTPPHGTAALAVDTVSIDYQADPGFTGLDQFTYEITDGVGNQATGLVKVTVVPAEAPPIILLGDNATTNNLTAIDVSVLANDIGTGLTVQSVSGLTPASAGSVVRKNASQATFTPSPTFTGTATFTYVAQDAYGNSGSQICTVAVTAPPAATYANGYEQKANTYIGPDSEAMTGFPVYFDFSHPALRTQANGGSVRAQYQDIRLEDGAGNKLSHGLLSHDVVIGRIQGIYKRSRSASAWNSVEVYCGRQAGAVDEQDWAGATSGHLFFCRGDTGVDLTGNARHLTPTNVAVTTLFGYPAGTFNGSTSKLELADPSAWLNGASAYTLLMDLQVDQVATDAGFFCTGGTVTGKDVDCSMMARTDASLLADATKSRLWFMKQDTSISAVTTNCAMNGAEETIRVSQEQTFAMAWASGQAQDFYTDDNADVEIAKSVATPTGTLVVPGGPLSFGFGPRQAFTGKIGLVRMTSTRRSDAWIKAEQRNRIRPLLMIAAGAFRAPTASAPPVAFPDTATANGATPSINITPLANDTGAGLSLVSCSATSGTAVVLNSTTIRYTQDNSFAGTAYITYTIKDSLNRQSTSIISVAVTPPSVAAAADSFTVSVSTTNDLDVLANDTPTGQVEVDAITVQGTLGTASATPDKTKMRYVAGSTPGTDSVTYRAKLKTGSSNATAVASISVQAVSSIPSNLYAPPHRPLLESDILVWNYGEARPPDNWNKYCLLVWPDTPLTGSGVKWNISDARWAGIFEVGYRYHPIGNVPMYRHGGSKPNWTKLEPPLLGFIGALERSFANDAPSTLKQPNKRPFVWSDGGIIDTCSRAGDSAGIQQSCWWGDFWKSGIKRNNAGTYASWASDYYLMRTRIDNGYYFFSGYKSATEEYQDPHSDWMQNEALCLRSLNVWRFFGKISGQGFYLTGDQSLDANGYPKGIIPRDAYAEFSYVHSTPMPYGDLSTLFGGVHSMNVIALAQRHSTNCDPTQWDYTEDGIQVHVPAGRYYPLFLGPECYFEEKLTGQPALSNIIGTPYNFNGGRSKSNGKLTIGVDRRALDAGVHDYMAGGATSGGMFNRAANYFKSYVSIVPPNYTMVPDSYCGLPRRITTAADLLSYLDNRI